MRKPMKRDDKRRRWRGIAGMALFGLLLSGPVPASDASGQSKVSVRLPDDAILISRTQTKKKDRAFYRVVRGGKLTLDADHCTVLVEKGGQVTVRGSANEIYNDSGDRKSVVEGENNMVFLTFLSPPHNPGKNNRLHPVQKIDVIRGELPPPPEPSPTPSGAEAVAEVPPEELPLPVAPAAEEEADQPPDPPVAKTPWIAELLSLLPAKGDPMPDLIAPREEPSDFNGEWRIIALEPDSAGGIGPDASGSISFDPSGTGKMKILIDIMGQEILREGYFVWKSDASTLTINEGTKKVSVWQRAGGGDGEQFLVLKGRGPTDFRLRLARQKTGN